MKLKVEDIFLRYDHKDARFDYSDVQKSLGKLDKEEKARPEYLYEITAFSLQPTSDNGPWDSYFGPQLTFMDANGHLQYYPAFSDITKEAVLYWEKRYKEVKSSLLIQRYAALVWEFKKTIAKQKYEPDLYKTYLGSMLDVCNRDLASHPIVTTVIFERLFELARRNDGFLQKVKQALKHFEKRHATDTSVRYWACQFLLMQKYKKDFNKAEINALVNKHEDRLKRLTANKELSRKNVWIIAEQCNLLADYYYKCSQKDAVKRVVNELEKAFRLIFDNIPPLQKIGILQNLHYKYNHYSITNEAKRILVEIQNEGHKAADNLESRNTEFSIPHEIYEQAELLFGKGVPSDSERWRNFATYFIPCREDEEIELKDLVKRYPLKYMTPTNMMDVEGRLMSVIGDYQNDPEGNLILHITEKMNIEDHYLAIAIQEMVKSGLMNTERIMSDIIQPCPLFVEDSYGVIREALDFLFKDKAIIACHLLIPQLERAIRKLVEMSYVPVIKQQGKGRGYQLITLDELLRTKPVEDTLRPDGALYLRLVLTDQRSLNMRNSLCHGIVPPHFFEYRSATRLIHVLVIIGMIREKEDSLYFA